VQAQLLHRGMGESFEETAFPALELWLVGLLDGLPHCLLDWPSAQRQIRILLALLPCLNLLQPQLVDRVHLTGFLRRFYSCNLRSLATSLADYLVGPSSCNIMQSS
jgi:hypothetical protein